MNTTIVRMPKKGSVNEAFLEKGLLEIGFRFEPLDEIFVAARLPTGWKESNSYWSKAVHLNWLVDEYGRRRISMYDDNDPTAFIHQRYTYTVDAFGSKHPENSNRPWRGTVLDAIRDVVWYTASIGPEPCCNSQEKGISSAWMDWDHLRTGLDTQCVDCLNANYPDWRNPFAYW